MEKKKQASYDWERIKNEYLNSSVSSRALAERYGLAEATLRKRRHKEGWDAERELRRAERAERAKEAAIEAQIDIARTAQETLEILIAKLHVAACNTEAFDVRGLKDLASAMSVLHDIGVYDSGHAESNIEVTLGEEANSYAD